VTTEDDFQSALDIDPQDWQTRQVFADWLQDRNDPRAEGYRTLGAGHKCPHNVTGVWSWSDVRAGHGSPAQLKLAWVSAMPALSYPSRRAAEDAAATAFAGLAPEIRSRISTGMVAAYKTPGQGSASVSARTTALLRELIDAVSAAGGVVEEAGSYACRSAPDLGVVGELYVSACGLLGVIPDVEEDGDEDDSDDVYDDEDDEDPGDVYEEEEDEDDDDEDDESEDWNGVHDFGDDADDDRGFDYTGDDDEGL
jgi:uncharacterized protein (TIGR02996 family)